MELIYVNSQKRTTGTSSNFTVTFTDRFRRLGKLEFYNVNIPYTWYDFNDGNCTICTIGGHLITIPAGTYTIPQVKTAIEAAAVAAGTSTTVTYNTDHTISISGATIDPSVHKGAVTLGLETATTIPVYSNELVFHSSNRSFTITMDGIDTTVNVTAGNYTQASLAKELQTQLITAGGWNSLYVTYSTITDRITISGVRTSSFTTATISYSKSSISNKIGLCADINIAAGTTISATFHKSPIVQTRYLTIRSNTIANIAYGPHPYKHYCIKIIVDQPPYFYINYDIPTAHKIDATKGKNLSNMDFVLLDQDGVIVDLNGFEWSLAIVVYY
jgi:hypothetical protein